MSVSSLMVDRWILVALVDPLGLILEVSVVSSLLVDWWILGALVDPLGLISEVFVVSRVGFFSYG